MIKILYRRWKCDRNYLFFYKIELKKEPLRASLQSSILKYLIRNLRGLIVLMQILIQLSEHLYF